MKASLRVEAIGHDTDQALRELESLVNCVAPGLGTATFGGGPVATHETPRYWVAEILGLDPVYQYQRKFLRGKKDYKFANSVGSRGVYAYYLLESGKLYEVKAPVSWKRSERYFCVVNNDGDIVRVGQEFIEQWENDHWVLPY